LRTRPLALRVTPRDRLLASTRLAAHAREIGGLVRSLEPDIVAAWGTRSAIACRMLLHSPRAVSFQHNDFLRGRATAWLVRWAASGFALVTVPSHAVAVDLDPSGRLGDRLRVINPGVDLTQFDVRSAPTGPPEVLMVGALTRWKRVDLALEVCALVRRERPDVRLRVLGEAIGESDAGFLAELRERTRRPDLAGAVEFAGAVEDVPAELVRATCLLHCAPREPFGIAVLEALAAGRPVVAPAAGGPAEVVDGACGILYPPGNAPAAARAVLELVDDPQRAARMGAAGREHARRHFRHEASQAAFAEALRPLIGAGRGFGGARAGLAPAGLAPAGELSLVTVTHNSAAPVRRLLRSVERHLPGVPVIVVDCRSEDETVEVARASPSALVIALDSNVGFGAACNRGLAKVGSAISALVNPDVELIDHSLLGLAAEAARRDLPERLLAPLVLLRDGTRQDSVHPMPTSAADLLRSLVPPVLLPGRLGAAAAPWRADAPRPVGWAIGCALVACTETFRRLGPFDEGFFMFGEDLDLGLRAARSGVRTWFWPECRVVHDGAHSTLPAYGDEPFELLARARHTAVERRLGRSRAAIDDGAQALTFASRRTLKRAIGMPSVRERRQLAALAALHGKRRATAHELP
jgi:glycosyltransferase involved in cell wall biosynthesis/GT2 family glycosyltransferase